MLLDWARCFCLAAARLRVGLPNFISASTNVDVLSGTAMGVFTGRVMLGPSIAPFIASACLRLRRDAKYKC